MAWKIVIDTNVFVAALRSQRGASYRLLSLIGGSTFELNVSVPLVLEYEAVAKRLRRAVALSAQDIDEVLDYLCRVATHRQIFYLWHPFLRDPQDDMVLELAVAAGCNAIVTFHARDFIGARQFGIRVLTPQEVLEQIGA